MWLIAMTMLLGGNRTFGNLGETEEQCGKRYGTGETVSFDAGTRTKKMRYSHWFSDDVEVDFANGIAVEVWIKTNSLTEQKLAEYLDQNSQGHKWGLVHEKGQGFGYDTFRWYDRDDGATAFWANYAGPAGLELQAPEKVIGGTMIGWMKGEHVVVQKNTWVDDTWTIDPSQVTNFVLHGVTQNSSNKSFSATVSFQATANGKGIDCQAVIVYQRTGPDHWGLMSFAPTKITKTGDW